MHYVRVSQLVLAAIEDALEPRERFTIGSHPGSVVLGAPFSLGCVIVFISDTDEIVKESDTSSQAGKNPL